MPSPVSPPPLFNVISALLPVAGGTYAWSAHAKSSADTMGGAIGQLIGVYVIFAAACLLGEVAAVVSLLRGERPGWLSVIGVLLNLTAVIPPIIVFTRRA